jgi:signal transduction histidine kinase
MTSPAGRRSAAAPDATVTAISFLVLGAAAIGIGFVAVQTAWRSPGFSAASSSLEAAALTLAAGWILVATGIDQIRRGRRRQFGALLALTGIAWLATEWANPAIGSALAFTIGLVARWLYPAIMLHALIAFDRGRYGAVDRALIVAGYSICGGLLGLVPAATFDAQAIHCGFCPSDVIAIFPSAGIAAGSMALGIVAGASWAVIAAATITMRLARRSPAARRLHGAVAGPVVLFLVVLGIELGRVAGRSVLPTDEAALLLRLIEAGLLVAVAIGVMAEPLRARWSRNRVARVVADLGQSPAIGGLRDALATTLSDPELRIGYLVGPDRYVDASGNDIDLSRTTATDRGVTPIVRDGVIAAVLEHRADVLDMPATIDEVVRAARLGLEHERLQATTRAQLADIAAARKRIVAAADEERRRLERDLHDGAQQHLIAISIRLRVLADDVSDADGDALARLAEAGRELAIAIDELREVAHGIFPSILADEGLVAAVEGLAEGASVPVSIDSFEADGLDQVVEAAAYTVVAEVVGIAREPVRLTGAVVEGVFRLRLSANDIPEELIVELGDRVGAVDGRLVVGRDSTDGRLVLNVDLPCAS